MTDTPNNGNGTTPEPEKPKRKPISFATRNWVKERDKFRCVDCGTHENLTVDHILAVANGGTNDVENLTTRCQSCNSSKGTKPARRRRAQTPPARMDRLGIVEDRPFTQDSLVGSFFHSDSARAWQGCVVAEVQPGIYLVELFEWIAGFSSNQHLVQLTDMLEWTFYDSADWMNNAYRTSVSRQWNLEPEPELELVDDD